MAKSILFARGTAASHTSHASDETYADTLYFTKASANAAYDTIYVGGALVGSGKIENLLTSAAAAGAIYYYNGTGITSLAKGATGKLLKATASGLEWGDAPAYTQDVNVSSSNVYVRLLKDGAAVANNIQFSGDSTSCIQVSADGNNVKFACVWSNL